jgi:hypothetical protein
MFGNGQGESVDIRILGNVSLLREYRVAAEVVAEGKDFFFGAGAYGDIASFFKKGAGARQTYTLHSAGYCDGFSRKSQFHRRLPRYLLHQAKRLFQVFPAADLVDFFIRNVVLKHPSFRIILQGDIYAML